MPTPYIQHDPLPQSQQFERESLNNFWFYMSIVPVGSTEAYVLPTQSCFKSLSMTLSAGGGMTQGEISFFIEVDPLIVYYNQNKSANVTSYDLVEQLKTAIFPTLYAGWGWLKSEAGLANRDLAELGSMPVMRFQLSNIQADFQSRGVDITANLVSEYGAALTVSKDTGPRAFFAMRPDEIITDILDHYGITSRQIDHCPVKIDAIRMDSNQSPLDFITRKILPLAKDANGQTYAFFTNALGKVFFVRQRRGVKATADDGTYSETTYELKKQFMYRSGQDSLVLDFRPEDGRIAAMFAGGANTSYHNTPGASGEPIERAATPSTGLENRGVGEVTEGYEDGMSAFEFDGTPTSSTIRVHGSEDGAAEAAASVHHADSRQNMYKATMRTVGIAYLNPLDYVQVDQVDPWGFLIPQSGVYQIFEFTHTLSPGRWETEFKMQRQGDSLGSELVVGKVMTAAGGEPYDYGGGYDLYGDSPE